MRLSTIILLVSLAVAPAYAYGATDHQVPGLCNATFRDLHIKRTFGVEVERIVYRLASTQINQNYYLYGKDSTGIWRLNYIRHESMYGFSYLEALGVKFSKTADGGRVVENWDTMPKAALELILRKVTSINDASSLFMGDLFALRHKNNQSDEARAVEVTFENHLVLEFKTIGGLNSGIEVKKWMQERSNEGILSLDKPTMGHVHFVPEIASLNQSIERTAGYEGLKGVFGDLNDYAEARAMYKSLEEALSNPSIRILTREMYEEVQTSSQGIFVEGKTDPTADAHFPEEFKRLPLGLRSGPKDKVTTNGIVKYPHLEGRGMIDSSIETALSLLPGDQLASTIPLISLTRHRSKDSRGVVSAPTTLEESAQRYGIDPKLISLLEKRIETISSNSWSKDQIRALILFPLTDWINHPAARRNLANLTAERRAQLVNRYRESMDEYVLFANSTMSSAEPGKKIEETLFRMAQRFKATSGVANLLAPPADHGS